MGQSFRELTLWHRAVQLTLQIYDLTAAFPTSERFGLPNQLRRAADSIASNIAEGYGRTTKSEYVQFRGHARGTVPEVETQFVISRALGFGAKQQLDSSESLCNEIGRM